MASKRKHRHYTPSPPEKRGHWTHIIGDFTLLPADHPVTQRLFAAGMAKLVFMDDYLRFEDLEREARNER